jgi:hypothetical protein
MIAIGIGNEAGRRHGGQNVFRNAISACLSSSDSSGSPAKRSVPK